MSQRTYSFPGFDFEAVVDTPAGTILVFNQLIGITTDSIPKGTKAGVAQQGHFLFDTAEAKAIAYTKGAPVYITASAGIGTITATGIQIGVATKDSPVGQPLECILKLGH